MTAISFDSDLVQLTVGDPGIAGRGIASEQIIQGHAVAKSGDVLVVATSQVDEDLANVVGIALTMGQDNQPITFATEGVIDFGSGATMVQGRAYYLGADGDIVPETDLGSGDYTTLIGFAQSTRLMLLSINPTGITRT